MRLLTSAFSNHIPQPNNNVIKAIRSWQNMTTKKAVIGANTRLLTIGMILLNRLNMPVALPDNDG